MNRIKTADLAVGGVQAACQEMTAPFRAVSLIKRGGLPPRIPCLALLLLLCACAPMTKIKVKPSDETRNLTTAEKVETVFEERRKASTRNPHLEIYVTSRLVKEESFQRRYIEKRVPKIRAYLGLWLGGVLVAAGGYFVMEQGYVVLGRDLMGLGLIVPVGGAAIVRKDLGEEWKPETRDHPIQTKPASNLPITVSAGDRSWIANTDDEGLLNFDIADLTSMAEPGGSLTISLQSEGDTTQRGSFTVEPSIVAYYRTPPVSTITAVEPASSSATVSGSVATIAILDFEGLGISEQEARVLTNRLGTHMVQLGTYKIIERGQMQQVLEEQDFQLTGCTSDECAVEIGQLLGVQQMLAGSFGRIESMYLVDMRIIDVETGGILRTASYEVTGGLDLLIKEGLVEAAKRIAGVD